MQLDRTLIAKKAWETRRKNGNDTPWNKQEFIMVNCPTCKKVFSARQWKLRIGRDKHCSRECAYPGGIDITCWQCSKVVKVNRSRKNTAPGAGTSRTFISRKNRASNNMTLGISGV